MSARMLRAGAAAALLPLAGCVNMSGLGGGSKYACAAPEGVACDSVSGTYANAVHHNLPSQRARSTPPSGAPSDAAHAPANPTAAVAIPAPARQPINAALVGVAETGLDGRPSLALRSQARVLRLWTKPWEDADGDLWDQGYVYVQVDGGRWQIDHVRQRIRDQYTPLRPPPAATSSDASAPLSSASADPEHAAQDPTEGHLSRPASFNPFPSLTRPPAGPGNHPQ